MNVRLRTILSKHGNFIFISIMWRFFWLIYRPGFPHKLWKSKQCRQLLSGRKDEIITFFFINQGGCKVGILESFKREELQINNMITFNRLLGV